MLVSWQMPVFPGGLQVVGVALLVSVVVGFVLASGQHLMELSPGQYPEIYDPPAQVLLVD